MTSHVEETAGQERRGFRTWAIFVGGVYGAVTLFVAAMAVIRVMAAEPETLSGYAPSVSVQPAPLVGDFWTEGARRPFRFVDVDS